MKKRITFTSLLCILALCLIVSALTTPASALGEDMHDHTSATVNETGMCSCGTQFVACTTIMEEVQYYTDLHTAVRAVENSKPEDQAVIKLLTDIDLMCKGLSFPAGVFTLDLNNCRITDKNSSYPTAGTQDCCKITIADFSDQGGGSFENFAFYCAVPNTSINFTGGSFFGGFHLEHCREFRMSGGVIQTNGIGIDAWDTYVEITGGSIQADFGILASALSSIEISGGEIKAQNTAIDTLDSDLIISGGSISGGICDIWLGTNDTILVVAGESSEGPIFPGGITVKGITLNEMMDNNMCYWAGDNMLLVAEDCNKIEDMGDIIIKPKAAGESSIPYPTTRLAGSDRIATSFLVADQLKAQMGVEKFENIIVASGKTFADALPGSYLAAVKNAPILLTLPKDKFVAQTAEYIRENLNPGGTVYILGGETAVPYSMEAALSGIKFQRVAGADRFGTNLEILKVAGVKAGDEVLVCTAMEFADSLSAAATGKPILLVYKKLTTEQKNFLNTQKGSKFVLIGGTSAVPDAFLTELVNYGSVTRLAGKDRLETSLKVAQTYFPDAKAAVVAYGWDFPDGLCGGSLAYATKSPLILAHSKEKLYKFTADYTVSAGLKAGYVLGGEKLVEDTATRAIFGMAADAQIVELK